MEVSRPCQQSEHTFFPWGWRKDLFSPYMGLEFKKKRNDGIANAKNRDKWTANDNYRMWSSSIAIHVCVPIFTHNSQVCLNQKAPPKILINSLKKSIQNEVLPFRNRRRSCIGRSYHQAFPFRKFFLFCEPFGSTSDGFTSQLYRSVDRNRHVCCSSIIYIQL